jgi:hypothetical protein
LRMVTKVRFQISVFRSGREPGTAALSWPGNWQNQKLFLAATGSTVYDGR